MDRDSEKVDLIALKIDISSKSSEEFSESWVRLGNVNNVEKQRSNVHERSCESIKLIINFA